MSTSDTDDLLIASQISDTRIESSYEIETAAGRRQTVLLVEFPTIDDLMVQGMRNVAGTIKFRDIKYQSLMDRDLVTQLVRVHLPIERSS
jgi:hypothetical protein